MRKRVSNVEVFVEPGESISSAISRFKKKCKNSGMHNSLKRYYVSRSEERRLKKHTAVNRRKKQVRKNKMNSEKYRDNNRRSK